MNIFQRINSDQLSRCFGSGTYRINSCSGRIFCLSIKFLGEQFSFGQPFSSCFSTNSHNYFSVPGDVGNLRFYRSTKFGNSEFFRSLRLIER